MRAAIDRALVALTGSETRALTLAPIANASAPLSAYRVATIVGLPRTKVYRELERLARAGIVTRSKASDGTSVWWVSDPDIRQLFRRRARVGWSGDLAADSARLALRTRKVLAFARANPIDPSLLSKRSSPRHVEEFARPREKDEVLRRLGLKPAGRATANR